MENRKAKTLRSSQNCFLIVTLLIYFVVVAVGIAHHEMWRDELQAWLIARDSTSLSNLVENLKYEGHPGLWHTLLYAITRLTHNPHAMQGLHLLIACGTAFLTIRYSPFTKLQKIFLLFGYFSLYEYALISRNYSIAVFLLYLVCTLYSNFQKNFFWIFLILGMVANTNFFGLMISVSLATAFSLRFLAEKYRFGARLSSVLRESIIVVPALSVYLSSTIAALLIIMPPADRGRGMTNRLTLSTYRLYSKLTEIWRGYIPIPAQDYHFWNTHFFLGNDTISEKIRYQAAGLAVCLILICITIKLFQLSKTACLSYIAGNILIFSFFYIRYSGDVRHFGSYFILLVVCLWIGLSERNVQNRAKNLQTNQSRSFSFLLSLLLSTQLIAAFWPYHIEFHNPFSLNKAAADFIREYKESNHSADFIVSGYRNSQTASLSAFLDIPIYYPQNEDYGSFVVWNIQNLRQLTDEEILEITFKESSKHNKKCLLAITHRLAPEIEKSYQTHHNVEISHLRSFTGSIVSSEDFHIYELSPESI